MNNKQIPEQIVDFINLRNMISIFVLSHNC